MKAAAAALAVLALAAAPVSAAADPPCDDALAYVDTRGGGEDGAPVRTSVVVAQADGSGAREVADGTAPLVWAPDEHALLFERFDGGRYDLYRLRFDGGAPERLARGVAAATWAPDGETLAVARAGRAHGIYLLSLATRRRTLLVRGASGPSWSPDGRLLAYQKGADLYLRPMPRGRPVLLGPATSIAAWAPDSQRVAYLCGELLCVREIAGETAHLAVPDGAASPAWTSDGSAILVAAGGGLWSVALAGGSAPVRIETIGASAAAPAVRPLSARSPDCPRSSSP